jgi:glutamine amidotransferase
MIVVVDYGLGNVGSILNMFHRLGIGAQRSRDPAVIEGASKLVLPGVGAFDEGMHQIRDLGLREVLDRKVLADATPVMGICLGMQLMGQRSEEGSEHGLGWIEAESVRFRFAPREGERAPKVPHMGWSYVTPARDHPLVEGLPESPRFYFVHSYHLVCTRPDDVLIRARYGGFPFTAAVADRHIVGLQFHAEKSHRFGMALFRSFAAWKSPPPEQRQ